MTKKLSPQYAKVLKHLQRKRGVSVDDLVAEFGVLRHTARALISITKARAGVNVERGEDGRYRIAR